MANTTAVIDISNRPGTEVSMPMAVQKIYQGAAVGIIAGTGDATPLNIATGGMQFVGVAEETLDNTVAGLLTTGTVGTTWIKVRRAGVFAFTAASITRASIGAKVYFLDDNSVTLTPGAIFAGIVTNVDSAGVVWVDIESAVRSGSAGVGTPLIAVSASGAIAPRVQANYVITKAGVAALTLAAPTATTDDGLTITITSGTANAHTLTATGLLNTGSASVNVATFAAFAGAGLTLVAYQGKWNVVASTGITFS
jgi:uncharacterized 2Fe-2S/4Fe-4S cluster protein (DUF4445 family)